MVERAPAPSVPAAVFAPTGQTVLSALGPHPKIAVVRASRIGDLICALPALHDIKSAVPDCELTLIALPLVHGLANRLPYVDRLESFPGFPGIAEQFFDPRTVLAFFQRMQTENFALAVQMHGSGTFSNPFCAMLGARLTAGFIRPGGHPALLSVSLPLQEEWSEVERCRALAAQLGAPASRPDRYMLPTNDDRASALSLLRNHPHPWIGVHPWAREVHKTWPLSSYLRAASMLQRRHGGTIFLLGSAGEQPSARQPSAFGGSEAVERLIDLVGLTSLAQTAAVIASLDLFLGNDSGPAHLAYLFATPSVTVFGGTDPQRWGPAAWPSSNVERHRTVTRTFPCRPCEVGDCRLNFACLADIQAQEVADVGTDLLAACALPGRAAKHARKRVEPAITGGL